MPLLKSPNGLLKPYTREGVTTLLRRTAPHMAMMEKATKELQKVRKAMDHRLLEEPGAEKLLRRVKYLSMVASREAAAVDSILALAAGRVEKYLSEASDATH